jgi:hypothetical protein
MFQMRFMMHQNEAFHAVDFSLSIKMALGIGLFCNALLALGSERHEKIYRAALNGEVTINHFPTRILAHDLFLHFRLSPPSQSPKYPTAATLNKSEPPRPMIKELENSSSTRQTLRAPSAGLEIWERLRRLFCFLLI